MYSVLDRTIMERLIDYAWEYQTLCLPNPSVGAAVFSPKYQILSFGIHKKAGGPHAEVYAFANAAKEFFTLKKEYSLLQELDSLLTLPLESQSLALHKFLCTHTKHLFSDCRVYVSLEPCNHSGKTPPCANLLEILHPEYVFIACRETNKQAQGGGSRLQQADIKVCYGLCEDRAKALLLPFLCYKQNGAFRLFKLAMRLDGDYLSGRITHDDTQIFTHNQRSVSNCIIVSGRTFLHDLPKLDCRFATSPFDNSHLPQVKILTRENIDTALNPNITPSRIRVCHGIEELALDSGFSIIEGGLPLLQSLLPQIDMLLLHIAPNFLPDSKKFINKRFAGFDSLTDGMHDFRILHTHKHSVDMSVWLIRA